VHPFGRRQVSGGGHGIRRVKIDAHLMQRLADGRRGGVDVVRLPVGADGQGHRPDDLHHRRERAGQVGSRVGLRAVKQDAVVATQHHPGVGQDLQRRAAGRPHPDLAIVGQDQHRLRPPHADDHAVLQGRARRQAETVLGGQGQAQFLEQFADRAAMGVHDRLAAVNLHRHRLLSQQEDAEGDQQYTQHRRQQRKTCECWGSCTLGKKTMAMGPL